MQSNYFIADDPLSLERIRSVLTRLEDTILFSLIERAQFAHNPRIYEARAFPELTAMGFEGSWLRWYLQEIETFHGACAPVAAVDMLTRQTSESKAIHEVRTLMDLSANVPDMNPARTNTRSRKTCPRPFSRRSRTR
jgi:hypothetical protein